MRTTTRSTSPFAWRPLLALGTAALLSLAAGQSQAQLSDAARLQALITGELPDDDGE